MNNSYQYITIEGVIGAGKTTFTKLLSKHIGAKLILEEFEENAFLPSFYKDPTRYAFPVEMSFIADRYNQLKSANIKQDLFQPTTIADYFIDKSLIFAQNNLKIDEFNLYRKIFYIMRNSLPKPDLIIYLNQSVENLLKNIKGRGRDYEKNISATYLNSLHQGYMNHFKVINDIPILIIDTRNLDFVHRTRDLELMLTTIEKEYKKGISFMKF
jgi:deoxyadenosine/deoxycytidine kinase